MSGSPPEEEEPPTMLSTPGAAAEWQAYPDQRLDELEANLRANGPQSSIPEIRAFAAMMARVAPDADFVRAGRAVILAAREAARDERALADLRKKARAEIDAALRLGTSPDGELGLPRIGMIAERAGLDPAIARAPEDAFLIPRDAPRRNRELALALRNLHSALAAPGMSPTHGRRLAERVATVFAVATGRKPTVTLDPLNGSASGDWVDFLSASAALAGIRVQPSEISNVARAVANPMKKRKNSRVN